MMHFKEGEKVRMVWKTFFCGGDLRGVVTNVSPSDKKIIVKMRNGDYVVHDTTRTEFSPVKLCVRKTGRPIVSSLA